MLYLVQAAVSVKLSFSILGRPNLLMILPPLCFFFLFTSSMSERVGSATRAVPRGFAVFLVFLQKQISCENLYEAVFDSQNLYE